MSRRRAQAAARIDEPVKPLDELLDELEKLEAESREAMQSLIRELRPIATASRQRIQQEATECATDALEVRDPPSAPATAPTKGVAPIETPEVAPVAIATATATPALPTRGEQLDLLAPRASAAQCAPSPAPVLAPASAKGPGAIGSATRGPATEKLPTRAIDEAVLRILSTCTVEGSHVIIPGGLENPLPRELYTRVDEILRALGGKWNRKARAHVFAESPADVLDAAITSGRIVLPKDLGWFPTPDALAREIVERADVQPGMFALEPSAGEGAIARALRDAGATVECREIDPSRAAKLRGDRFDVIEGDFLAVPMTRRFERVAMNPPFGKRADVAHVKHAFEMLIPGGRLVAIMSAGVAFRQDRECIAFRELVAASRGSIDPLPEGSFVESGTGVRTVVVEMRSAA